MNFLVNEVEFQNEIQDIEQTFLSKNAAYIEIIHYCREILEKYRIDIYVNDFPDTSLEILFFKKQKQLPLTHLIYYSNLYSFANQLPKGGKKFQENFIECKINRINKFFTKNSEFASYMELDLTCMDELYFTRKNNLPTGGKNNPYYRDPKYSTSHDLILGELYGNKLYLKFLQQQLDTINDPFTINLHATKRLEWTETKAALIELIYALYEQKAFNGGRADLKDIAEFFQKVYDFDSGDIYRTFSEIKSRKKSQTQFLDELSLKLSLKMREI